MSNLICSVFVKFSLLSASVVVAAAVGCASSPGEDAAGGAKVTNTGGYAPSGAAGENTGGEAGAGGNAATSTGGVTGTSGTVASGGLEAAGSGGQASGGTNGQAGEGGSSGQVTTLASTFDQPNAIAVDATSVYWTNYDGDTVAKLTPK